MLVVSIFMLRPCLNGQELSRFEYQHAQMGTLFRIVLYAEDAETANRAAQTAFARIDDLNDKLSDYLPLSELNNLSSAAGSGEWLVVSDDLWQVLERSVAIAEDTDGAFDITIGPLSRLWRKAFEQKEFPEDADLAEARKLVDYRNIGLRPWSKEVTLSRVGMKLDLGGIAKGYALDQAMIVLLEHGIESALVDGGGDVLATNPPPGKKGWKVLYQKYTLNDELVTDSLWLANQAVATSGDHYRFLVWEDKRYSHIIDPRTGLGLTNQRLVTVIGPSGIVTDALASACSVMDDEQRGIVLHQFPDVSVRVFTAGAVTKEVLSTKY